jgi:hypothetical protein
LSSHSPFWFAKEDLLTDLLRAEIHSILELFAQHPDLREFFDLPQATSQQLAACFAVLAHRKVMGEIYDQFAGFWQQSPSLGDEEKAAIARTQNLFADDAPAWVRDVKEIAELLPSRIYEALPEPLRRGGYNGRDAEEVEFIDSVASRLSSVQEIQALSRKVFEQQLKRLEGRWMAESRRIPAPIELKESKRPLKGTEGLGGKKIDLSRYMHSLTDKQEMAFSLKHEYGLGLTQIALRMGLDRKTAYEHIHAAAAKIDQIRSGEKRRARHGGEDRPED